MNGTGELALLATRIQRRSLTAGIGALVISAAGAFFNPGQFFHSYLVGFLLWSGVALGCLPLLMLYHLTGGRWGLLIRRLLECATATIPLVAVLAVPVLGGMRLIYAWTHVEIVAADALLRHKRVYLNAPFFVARTALYFACWMVLAHFLNKWSAEQDRSGSPLVSRRLYHLSGPGIVLYGLAATFASVDWLMSLEPDWFSTIFGMMFMVGQVLSALAFVSAMLALVVYRSELEKILSGQALNDLGNLLLTFLILWAYLAYSQYLIMWAGNLADEIPWYLRRTRGGWQMIGILLIVFHFAAPFFVLLSRQVKRRVRTLAGVAIAIFVARWLDMIWMVEPAFSPGQVHVHWMDAVVAFGIGGVWMAAFLGRLKRVPLVPPHDAEAVEILQEATAEG